MTWKLTALVGLGGALGAISRAWAHQLCKTYLPWDCSPWDFLAINVLGSFAIGVVLGWQSDHFSPEARLFFGTGFCGAFTTFSTFSHQTLELFAKGKTSVALANIAASILLCLAGTWAGIHLVHR